LCTQRGAASRMEMHAQFKLLNRSIIDGFDKISSTLCTLTRPTSSTLRYSQSRIPDPTGISMGGGTSTTREKITSTPRRRSLHATQLAVSTAVAQIQPVLDTFFFVVRRTCVIISQNSSVPIYSLLKQ
jgi:hypothetical protein